MKAIITVIGNDKVGIIYEVSGVLVNANVNILDIEQTTMQEFFTMVMLVDISKCTTTFEKLQQTLSLKGEEIGLKIIIQHEEIFKSMHRI